MLKNLRNPRIGFVNLLMLGNFEKEAEDKAVELSQKSSKFLEKNGIEVYEQFPAVTNLSQARQTWEFFKEKKIDAVVLYSGTFSLGNLMSEIVRNLDCPFLIWGLDEYLIDKRILSGSMIGLMPAGPIFRSLDKRFSFVYGQVEEECVQEKVKVFLNVVKAIIHMRESRIGILGNRPDGFEISGFDELAIKKVFGTTLINLSMVHFFEKLDSIRDEEIGIDLQKSKQIFDIEKKDLNDAKELSRLYLAIKDTVEENDLQGYAPQCWPEFRMERKTPMCTANGRCTCEGIMAGCECDMDCTLTMLLLYAFTMEPAWTADFVNLVKENDSLLFWHCGNAPYAMSGKKPKIEAVYEGLAQTSTLKAGTVTVCRINHFNGQFEIHAGIGEAIDWDPLLKGSNMYIRMNCGNMEFVEALLKNGIPHHNAIVYGDMSEQLKEFSNFLKIPLIIK